MGSETPGPAPRVQLEKETWRKRLVPVLPRLVVSLVIAVGFFWILRHGGLPMLPPDHGWERITPWAVALYVALHCVAAFFRTYRWVYLLRPIAPEISAQRVLGLGFLGFGAVVFAPLRLGEVVRPWLLAQDGEVGFLEAAGTVAAERIIDGLVITALLLASLSLASPLDPLPQQIGRLPIPVAAVPAAAWAALALFSAAFVALALFYFARHAARRLVMALLGPLPMGIAAFVTAKMERLADGLRFLPSSRHWRPFLADTLLYWAAGATSFWVLMRACGLQASFVEACVTMGIMGIGTLIPSGPGFFGSHQLAAYCGLAMFFPESQVLSYGAVYTFISYTTNIIATAVLCLVGWWLMSKAPAIRRQRLPLAEEQRAAAAP